MLKAVGVIVAVARSLRLPLASIGVVAKTLGSIVVHVVGGGVVVVAVGRVFVFIPGHFKSGEESKLASLDTIHELRLKKSG